MSSFADSDMFARFAGIGVGHITQHVSTNCALSMEADKELDDDETVTSGDEEDKHEERVGKAGDDKDDRNDEVKEVKENEFKDKQTETGDEMGSDEDDRVDW